ncbi:MAG: DUF3168 domain-containing protein [Armatimonadota bacterium]
MASELQAVDRAVTSVLTADADVSEAVGNRIYAGAAPQGAVQPYVVFQRVGGADRPAVGGGETVCSRTVYAVEVVGAAGGFAELDPAAGAVDACLSTLEESVSLGSETYRVRGAGRVDPVRRVETVEGRRYFHVGGRYRIFAQRVG